MPPQLLLLQLIADAGAVLLQREIPEAANIEVAKVNTKHLNHPQGNAAALIATAVYQARSAVSCAQYEQRAGIAFMPLLLPRSPGR